MQIGTYAVVLYSIAYVFYQVSIAGEMQNIRLYIGSFAKGYLGEFISLVPKFIAVLIGSVMYQLTIQNNISFQYIFSLLFITTCCVLFLRQSINHVKVNKKESKSAKEIVFNIYNNIFDDFKYIICQTILYGTSGGMLYFYCVFFKVFLHDKLNILNNYGYLLQILIIMSLIVGGFGSLVMEKFISIRNHLFYMLTFEIVILYLTTLHLNNYKILLFIIPLGSFILGTLITPMLYLLRISLPENNKCTFLSIVKNVGSLILSLIHI